MSGATGTFQVVRTTAGHGCGLNAWNAWNVGKLDLVAFQWEPPEQVGDLFS
jgi:hypothetical protein